MVHHAHTLNSSFAVLNNQSTGFEFELGRDTRRTCLILVYSKHLIVLIILHCCRSYSW